MNLFEHNISYLLLHVKFDVFLFIEINLTYKDHNSSQICVVLFDGWYKHKAHYLDWWVLLAAD